MKAILFLLITSIGTLFSCQSTSEKNVSTEVLTLNKHGIDSVMNKLNYCDSFSIDFSGLYPIIDTLPNAANDTVYIDRFLKAKGFKTTSSGNGNWEKGPRIFDMELTKGDCNCHIYKKYYSNRKRNDGTSDLKVSEKIVCNSHLNAVE